MAILKPFRGCRFNPSAVGALSDVICPPYDMIGPQLKSELQQRSPYNAVHLEGGEQPDPIDPQAGYQQAAHLFRAWLDDGVLLRDDSPSFYLMRHAYHFGGRSYQHLGLFADVLVEDYDAGAVLPHEFTREPAVLDRVALLEACQAQFSPIMSLYRDAEGDLHRIFDGIMSGAPDASASYAGRRRRPALAHRRRRYAVRHHRNLRQPPGVPGRRPPPLRGRPALPSQPAPPPASPTTRRPAAT